MSEPGNSKTLLMFSGGRDSTIAALRLARQHHPLVLTTVTSSHLFGMSNVRRRLRELSGYLPAETVWTHVRQPVELATDTSFYERTCLPCHHAYVVICAFLARHFGASRIAFGYVSYQSDWPEQTDLAISSLRRTLDRHGLQLHLPAWGLSSRQEAIDSLVQADLDPASLEQKCQRQVSNVKLAPELLARQVALWEQAIDRSMERLDKIAVEIIETSSIGEIRGWS